MAKKKTPENKFNTKLSNDVLNSYIKHSSVFPSLLNDKYNYDTQGLYNELYKKYNGDFDLISQALTPENQTEHIGTDRYKKPNHPTFSNESKYYIPLFRSAGRWKDNYFIANDRNIKNMTNDYGSPLEYMKFAEDYNMNSIPDIGLKYKGKVIVKPENPYLK